MQAPPDRPDRRGILILTGRTRPDLQISQTFQNREPSAERLAICGRAFVRGHELSPNRNIFGRLHQNPVEQAGIRLVDA